MPVAKITANKRATATLILTVGLLLAVVVSATLFIILNQSQAPQKKASTIPTLSCRAESAYCSWDATDGSTAYQYDITDTTTGQAVKSGRTGETKITFTPQINHIYRCTVKIINVCGVGPEAEAQNSCSEIPQPTPTTSPTPKITNTPTPTPTKGPSPTPTNPPTGGPTPTPTGVITPTNGPTATPTPILIVSVTNTPLPTATAPPAGGSPTSPPTTPALPSAGNFIPALTVLIFSSGIIVLGLLL